MGVPPVVCLPPLMKLDYLSSYDSRQGYTTRDSLSQHLQAIKVACLWYVAKRQALQF